MPQVDQFRAWLSVDDVISQEYGIEHSEDGKTVTCWIPSEAGKKFAVSWEALYPPSNTPFAHQGTVFVDGKYCSGMYIKQYAYERTATIDTVYTSPTTLRPLMFSQVELTDDDAYLHATTEEFGDIRLKISEVIIVRGSGKYASSVDKVSTPQLHQQVHERSKTGSTHCVGLGDEIKVPRLRTTTVRKVRTICTFLFKYRPMGILQANGIAPRDRKRKEAPPPDDFVDLTLTDVKEEDADVKRQIKELEARLKSLRGERGVKKRTKTETAHNELQTGELIDLT